MTKPLPYLIIVLYFKPKYFCSCVNYLCLDFIIPMRGKISSAIFKSFYFIIKNSLTRLVVASKMRQKFRNITTVFIVKFCVFLGDSLFSIKTVRRFFSSFINLFFPLYHAVMLLCIYKVFNFPVGYPGTVMYY